MMIIINYVVVKIVFTVDSLIEDFKIVVICQFSRSISIEIVVIRAVLKNYVFAA